MRRRRKRKDIINQIKETAFDKVKTKENKPNDYLSSGSTLLNLACSDDIYGAFLKGKYYFLVGDSSSGKTFLSLTCFAESNLHSEFKNYRLIYDDIERGNLFNLRKLFGNKTADRIEPPALDEEGNPLYSSTIEEFYFNLDDACSAKRPFIYVLDSMDALTSEAEIDKFTEIKKSHKEGKTTTGSFGDGKAKKNSSYLRQVLHKLEETKSILIIINQTRDNLGFGFEKKTRSGGHALRFYAAIELWSSVEGKIKKTINKKSRQIGIQAVIKIKKNRLTGQEHTIKLPIYWSYGIDDIGSCIDYLKSENFNYMKYFPETSEKNLINYIEDNNLELKLRKMVRHCWLNIKDKTELKRKKKYE